MDRYKEERESTHYQRWLAPTHAPCPIPRKTAQSERAPERLCWCGSDTTVDFFTASGAGSLDDKVLEALPGAGSLEPAAGSLEGTEGTLDLQGSAAHHARKLRRLFHQSCQLVWFHEHAMAFGAFEVRDILEGPIVFALCVPLASSIMARISHLGSIELHTNPLPSGELCIAKKPHRALQTLAGQGDSLAHLKRGGRHV